MFSSSASGLVSFGFDIVAGSHPLGEPLTSDVKEDFACYRLRFVVMCSGHDPVRTCNMGTLLIFLDSYLSLSKK